MQTLKSQSTKPQEFRSAADGDLDDSFGGDESSLRSEVLPEDSVSDKG